MNRKFQSLCREILAVLGCDPETPVAVALLPVLDGRVLDPAGNLKRQARLYGLWERAKQFAPGSLSEGEHRELEALVSHLELCLGNLDTADSLREP